MLVKTKQLKKKNIPISQSWVEVISVFKQYESGYSNFESLYSIIKIFLNSKTPFDFSHSPTHNKDLWMFASEALSVSVLLFVLSSDEVESSNNEKLDKYTKLMSCNKKEISTYIYSLPSKLASDINSILKCIYPLKDSTLGALSALALERLNRVKFK